MTTQLNKGIEMNSELMKSVLVESNIHAAAMMAAKAWTESEQARTSLKILDTPEVFGKDVAAVYVAAAKNIIAAAHCEVGS